MAFHWREHIIGLGRAPAYTLAGRSDGPVTSRAEGVAAVVAAGSAALNSAAINHAIAREKQRLRYAVERLFQGHQTGGLLAVAEIQTVRHGELTGSSLNYLSVEPGIYAQPDHAIAAWRRRDRLMAGHNPISYRFFWITRQD
ncbi:MAG: hypothetical protein ACRBBK_08445 [Paracoccaceae bacterium]